jgi:MYXO-CTERM domain-containing protein
MFDSRSWQAVRPSIPPVFPSRLRFLALLAASLLACHPPATEKSTDENPHALTLAGTYFDEQARLTATDGKRNDFFGGSVAISGDTAVVGAYYHDLLSAGTDAGVVYVYTRSGTTWSLQAELAASDAATESIFGGCVGISGDTMVVGAPWATVGATSQAGAAYVFTRSGTTWTQRAKLTASDGKAHDFFGISCAITSDSILIGAYYAPSGIATNAGAAYVFLRSGLSWSQQAKLQASDANSNDHFGIVVALEADSALIGAYDADLPSKTDAGVAYVFARSLGTWSQQAKLTAMDANGTAHFGGAVALSGDTALVGALGALNGSSLSTGASYVYARSGTTWTQQAKLLSSDGADGDYFGTGVALSGDSAIIGAGRSDISAVFNSGALYKFLRSGTTWTQNAKFGASSAAADDELGSLVAMTDTTVITGAYLVDTAGGTDAGAAVIFAEVPTKPDGSACAGGFQCDSGSCVDGVCCDTTCGGGSDADCQVCSVAKGAAKDGVCSPVKSGQLCRAAVGDCDAAESCDGTSGACPPDAVKPTTAVCRAANGPCDAAESCTGTSTLCPVDSVLPAIATCRPRAGDCDAIENCPGVAAPGNPCPPDKFVNRAFVCRLAAGDCDVAEFCSGTSAQCPTDVLAAATTECRAAAGLCDVAELCTGSDVNCPADHVAPSTKECRAAAAACDAPELCTGSAAACPADKLRGSGEVCRPAVGPCDAAELCSGTLTTCPPDAVLPSTTVCRPAVAGCDTPEYCSGSAVVCPIDTRPPTCGVSADLSVTLGATPSQIRGGGPISVEVTVRNGGNSVAAPITLRIDLPSGIALESSSGEGWSCQPSSGTVTCTRLELDVTTAPILTLVLVLPASSEIALSATVSSSVADPLPGNNSATLNLSSIANMEPDMPPAATGCSCQVGAASSPSGTPVQWGLLAGLWLLRRRRRA